MKYYVVIFKANPLGKGLDRYLGKTANLYECIVSSFKDAFRFDSIEGANKACAIARELFKNPNSYLPPVVQLIVAEDVNQDYVQLTNELCAWQETARQNHVNANYYRDIVEKIGKLFGEEAYTSEDGSKQNSVLCGKVFELVEKLVKEHKTEKVTNNLKTFCPICGTEAEIVTCSNKFIRTIYKFEID